MSRTLDDIARRAQLDPHAAIAAQAWLGPAIDDDASAGRFERWGSSTAIDERIAAAVVSPDIFAALHDRAGLKADWPVGNAGLLHVYGYLLSTVQTPYGLKRDRWLDGALARAYGLAPDEFVPWARERPLLERVSAAACALLERGPARACETPTGSASVALGRTAADGPWALVYAVAGRLVTTFPVASAEAVLEEWDADPARLRWNAAG